MPAAVSTLLINSHLYRGNTMADHATDQSDKITARLLEYKFPTSRNRVHQQFPLKIKRRFALHYSILLAGEVEQSE